MQRVRRPKANKKKIHSRNEFELCYLRHQYFRRVKYNPSMEEMKPFMGIATHLAKNTFFTYKNLFHTVGFEADDVVNIAQVHLVSFLGLFSLEKMPEKYNDFVKVFNNLQEKNPQENDVLNKNKANFTMFLKQRMEDVVRVCRQKARNIKGFPVEEFYHFYGPNKPPKIRRELLKNYEKLGFRKLDTAVFKSIKKKSGHFYLNFTFNGNYYISVPLERKSVNQDDFIGAGMDPRDSIHNMAPDEIYFNAEEISDWETKKNDFLVKPKDIKTNIIKNFIKTNKNKEEYKDEIKAARRLLKELE